MLHGASYNYRIERVLGQGAFGVTYLASVSLTGSLGAIATEAKVAVKEFFMQDINGRSGTEVTSGNNRGIFSEYRRKFLREAKALSHLKHPNIVSVLEAFEANHTVYYVMEYLDGCSLDSYISRNGRLSEAETLTITRNIGSALAYLHSNKMVHLDLKPANVMRKSDGTVVLIDFGLSKQYDANGEPENSTTVGQGTPGYAPLEQAFYRDGSDFPVTMDVYALGATMFKMLTGERPPKASDILNNGFPIASLKSRGVSPRLCSVIEKAMSCKRKDRYDSIQSLLDASRLSWSDDEPTVHVEVEEIPDRICLLLRGATTIFYSYGKVYVDRNNRFEQAYTPLDSLDSIRRAFTSCFTMVGEMSFAEFVQRYSSEMVHYELFGTYVQEDEYWKLLSVAASSGRDMVDLLPPHPTRITPETHILAFLTCGRFGEDEQDYTLQGQSSYCLFSYGCRVCVIDDSGPGVAPKAEKGEQRKKVRYNEDVYSVAILAGLTQLSQYIANKNPDNQLLLETVPFDIAAGPKWGDLVPLMVKAQSTVPTRKNDEFDFAGTDVCALRVGQREFIFTDVIQRMGNAPKRVKVDVKISCGPDIEVTLEDADTGKAVKYNLCTLL